MDRYRGIDTEMMRNRISIGECYIPPTLHEINKFKERDTSILIKDCTFTFGITNDNGIVVAQAFQLVLAEGIRINIVKL